MRYVSNDEITSLSIKPEIWKKWVKEAFLLKETSMLPHKISQTFDKGRKYYNTMPALMPDINAAGVKIVSRYPERKPTIQGELLLYDMANGNLKAIMDATWITSARTGAVAALALDTFSNSNCKTIAVIGLGSTAHSFLDVLLSDEKMKNITLKFMKYKDHAEKAFESISEFHSGEKLICDNYEQLIRDSDVIISCLTVSENLIGKDEWFKEGVLVIPVHTRGFQNCDLFFDKVYSDDTSHVEGFANFKKFRYFNEIDKVLRGVSPGRENDRERILSYNIGIALHDLYFAAKIYDMIDKNH